jgi:hypothetical protein
MNVGSDAPDRGRSKVSSSGASDIAEVKRRAAVK